jgi:hypothetical protein
MRQFHKPNEEKRMVAILKPSEYEDWLSTDTSNAFEFIKSIKASELEVAL